MVMQRIVTEPLPLDSGDYAGTYKQIGGKTCIDFVNTVSYPLTERRHDWLDRLNNFLLWARACDLVGHEDRARWERHIRSQPSEGKRALARIRHSRAVITAVLSPIAHGRKVPQPDVGAFNALLIAAIRHRTVNPRDLSWTWDRPAKLDHIIRPVAWDTAVVLTETDHSRIRYCSGCDWLFYDTTRNQSRRWCDMADCGSRDKSLRYYHRRKGTRAPGSASH